MVVQNRVGESTSQGLWALPQEPLGKTLRTLVVAASPPPLRASASAPAAPGFRLPDRPQGPLAPALRARLAAGGASFPPSDSAAAGRPLSGLHGSERPLALARSPPLSGPSRDSVRLPPPSRGWERGVGPGQVPAGREAQGTPPSRAPPASAPLRKSRFKTAGTFFSFFGTARFQQWLCAWSSKYGDFSEARSALKGTLPGPPPGLREPLSAVELGGPGCGGGQAGGMLFWKGRIGVFMFSAGVRASPPAPEPASSASPPARGRGGAKCSAGGAAAPAEPAEQTREPGRAGVWSWGAEQGSRSRAAGGWRRVVRWNHLRSGLSCSRAAQLASGRGDEAGGLSLRVQSHLRFSAFAGCALALSPPASSLQQPPKVRPATWGETLPPLPLPQPEPGCSPGVPAALAAHHRRGQSP